MTKSCLYDIRLGTLRGIREEIWQIQIGPVMGLKEILIETKINLEFVPELGAFLNSSITD